MKISVHPLRSAWVSILERVIMARKRYMASTTFKNWSKKWPQFGCRTTKIATSNDWNGITSKKPGTILSMQNVELGQTKVMQIRQRETLKHQGAITHEVCCLAAQYWPWIQLLLSFLSFSNPMKKILRILILVLISCFNKLSRYVFFSKGLNLY
jgi:hypothetical protein